MSEPASEKDKNTSGATVSETVQKTVTTSAGRERHFSFRAFGLWVFSAILFAGLGLVFGLRVAPDESLSSLTSRLEREVLAEPGAANPAQSDHAMAEAPKAASGVEAVPSPLPLMPDALVSSGGVGALRVGDVEAEAKMNEMAQKLSGLEARLENRLAEVAAQDTRRSQEGAALLAQVKTRLTGAVALARLEVRLERGAPFASELERVRSSLSGREVDAVSLLSSYAGAGVESVDALRRDFRHESRLAERDLKKAEATDAWSRFKLALEGLIAIRSLDAAPETIHGRYAPILLVLDEEKLGEAAALFDALSEVERAPLTVWRDKLEARIKVEKALDAVGVALVDGL